MRRPTTSGWRRAAGLAWCCAFVAVPARAGTFPAPSKTTTPEERPATTGHPEEASETTAHFSVGMVAGVTVFDAHLGDYRWDTRPAFALGTRVAWTGQRFGLGLGMTRARTTQASGIPGETTAPVVNLTGFDLDGRARLCTVWNTEVWSVARGGLMLIGYEPDVVTYASGIAGTPITVAYDGIREWTLGGALSLRHALGAHLVAGLDGGVTAFALDTAHRSGDEIVNERETFVNWDVRAELAWRFEIGR